MVPGTSFNYEMFVWSFSLLNSPVVGDNYYASVPEPSLGAFHVEFNLHLSVRDS